MFDSCGSNKAIHTRISSLILFTKIIEKILTIVIYLHVGEIPIYCTHGSVTALVGLTSRLVY